MEGCGFKSMRTCTAVEADTARNKRVILYTKYYAAPKQFSV